MKLAGKIALTDEGLAHLKKIQTLGNSRGIILPAEILYALGEPEEFLIYLKENCIVIRPYNNEEIVLDMTGD